MLDLVMEVIRCAWIPRYSRLERIERMASRRFRLSIGFLIAGWAFNLVARHAEGVLPQLLAIACFLAACVAWLYAAWHTARAFAERHKGRDRVVIIRLLCGAAVLGLFLTGAGVLLARYEAGDPQPFFIGMPSAGTLLAGLLVAVGVRYLFTSIAAYRSMATATP